MSYNKVIMQGNLTKDPELKYTPSQMAVVSFGIATNRKWKSKDGQEREDVCFVDCEIFGKRGEALNKYFHKGDPILIEGRLQLDTWQAKDGTNRSKHKISVEGFEFVGGKKDQQQEQSPMSKQGYKPEPVDDIPF